MEKVYQYALLLSAFLTALVLFSIGIRQIRGGRKHGAFLTALLIAFSFLCSLNIPVKSQTRSGQAGQSKEKYPESRVLDLNRTSEWRDFKAFWKKLDLVTPKRKTEGLSGPILEYYGSLTQEEAAKYRAELKTVTEGLEHLGSSRLLDSAEASFFARLCEERINQMAGFPFSMMTRMVPPPYLLRKEETIGTLERRIDALLALKQKGKIDQEECSSALRLVQKEIAAFCAYDAVTRGSLGYSLLHGEAAKTPDDAASLIDSLIKEYEAGYAEILEARKKDPKPQEAGAAKDTLDLKYRETIDSLKRLRRAMPFINEAVLDLEG